MLKQSLLFAMTIFVCSAFLLLPAYAGDQLQTRDRLKTCDQFVDEDGDGICDNCDSVECDGVCDQFVDEDGDGICDNCDCADCDGDGVCDQCPCGIQRRAGR